MASGLYLTVGRIQTSGGESTETVSFSNIASTTSAFQLASGKYGLTAIGTFVSATLQRLAGDGATWVTAATAFSTAGYETADLNQGQYRWAIA